MKSKILFAFFALVTSFSLVGCVDDDKEDDPKPSKATYQDTGSELIITYPLTDDNDKVIGTCKETVSYEGEVATGYTINEICNNADDAEKTYKEAMEEKENDPETSIKEVRKEGTIIILICVLPDEFSSVQVIRVLLQLQVAEANEDKELQKKLNNELSQLVLDDLIDDEETENSNEISYLKSITYTYSDGDMGKTVFTYDKNNRLTSITDTYETFNFVYLSDNKVKMVCAEGVDYYKGAESIITLDSTTNTISKNESMDGDIINYSYNAGFLASATITEDDYSQLYTWNNENLTTIKDVYKDELGESVTITYSDIDNNTNIDIALFMYFDGENPAAFAQFIKNISKKIPNSLTLTEDGRTDEVKFSISLDDKGRPVKMVRDVDEKTYTFEYYD